MNWTELLNAEITGAYGAAEGLFDLVEDGELGWKPEQGANWMTTGQLLQHVTEACGCCCAGFVTGDWKMPDGTDLKDVPPEEMMPPAEKMGAVDSVAKARELLAADKAVALQMVERAGEERLSSEKCSAPWMPGFEQPLGQHLLQMVAHLNTHKAQLYYYLKLQGKPVHTGHLYGMGSGC
ncbi:MAG: DinB family protein [Planctomycetota bacterium]